MLEDIIAEEEELRNFAAEIYLRSAIRFLFVIAREERFLIALRSLTSNTITLPMSLI